MIGPILRLQVIAMFSIALLVSIFSPRKAIKLMIDVSEQTKQELNNAK